MSTCRIYDSILFLMFETFADVETLWKQIYAKDLEIN